MEQAASLGDSPARIHKSADARVGGSNHGKTRFHGSKSAHGKVLKGGARPAEPGIVRQIDKHLCPLARLVSSQIGENGLEADQHACGVSGALKRGDPASGSKVPGRRDKAVDKREKALERDVLAEGDEMDLVVPENGTIVRGEEIGAVKVTDVIFGPVVGRAAEEKIGAGIFGHGGNAVRKLALLLKEIWNSRLRPDQESG